MTLVLRSWRVLTPQGERAAAIHIVDGKIEHVTSYDEVPRGASLHDYGTLPLLPGLVDTHVHANEPGRTHWEGFETLTRAAAAGGITTVVDMPLNSVPATLDLPSLRAKTDAARPQCYVDVGFWGGVVPNNINELAQLYDGGVFGFKCFLVHSGVGEFEWLQPEDVRRAAPMIRELNALLLAHAESPFVIEATAIGDDVALHDPCEYRTHLRARPPQAEVQAIQFLIDIGREFGCRIHIVHLAAPEALDIISSARAEGVPITVETCPHYLTFAAEDIPRGATRLKCAPPIRERERRERLWDGLRAGQIDAIVSDHSPCPPELKHEQSGDFLAAWGGIASLQHTLPAVWTGAQAREFSLLDVVRWMCSGPATLLGLQSRKGAIAEGFDADIAVFDTDAETIVSAGDLHYRHRLTAYEGMTLKGRVRATYLAGRKIYDDGSFAPTPSGKLLRRAADR